MNQSFTPSGAIGVFDSGYGGLTILRQMRQLLPEYDYIYLGDNARAPYGSRSFDVIYRYTLEAVEALFARGCRIVILACNTASAKALRSIQQNDLPHMEPGLRVLGVIRPTVEVVCELTQTRHVGILATAGTINSGSYGMEIHKIAPDIVVTGQACPMWVPLVENYEFDSPGADYFVKKRIEGILRQDPDIDTLVLACTHYPLLMNKIVKYTPAGVRIVPQGEYVADSLRRYLARHTDMDQSLSRSGTCRYFTTEDAGKFRESASLFMHEPIQVDHVEL
ncbi:MAG: glutamate racemase [Alloprevotella sp.]|nr:glutamate racemase [Alloprevotella sp.]MDY4568189.1 glutamate racemase [Alloprevotella sp.]